MVLLLKKKIISFARNLLKYFFSELFLIRLLFVKNIDSQQKFGVNIASTDTVKWHFAKCNNSKCNSIFLVHPEENPGELGFICPECSRKSLSSHIVQCSSCKTILNLIRISPQEEKVVFTVPKCSHCFGTIEDEWEIEPLYQPDSYI